jgi:hypothetical protein
VDTTIEPHRLWSSDRRGEANMSHQLASRRRFMRQVGLGSGALGLGFLGGIPFPDLAHAVCEAPAPPSPALSWGRDCRPIRPRRPASTLSSGGLQKLRDAYAAMRALDTSDPGDPRGFQQQANVHCWYCGVGTDIHGSWQFFAWHRAYLYFHERILGKLVNDMELRLPYWDWDDASHRKIPGGYTTPGAATNSLWNSTRGMSPTDEVPDEDVGTVVMNAALSAPDFATFGGTAGSSGIPEGAPHGLVHVDVGGNMGFLSTAARDPIFYAHHANVDKLWSDWNKAASTNVDPSDPAFLGLTWSFYDENKAWRSISAAEVLNHENQLRYTYGISRFLEELPCILQWIHIRTDWRATRMLRAAGEQKAGALKAIGRAGLVYLNVRGLAVPLDKSAVYRLYESGDAAKRDEGPGSPGYLGAFPVLLAEREGGHIHQRTRTVVLTVPATVAERLLSSDKAIDLAFVQRGLKGGERAPVSVKADDVDLSVGVLDK